MGGGFEICWDLTTALTNTDLVGNFLQPTILLMKVFQETIKSVMQTSLT